MFEKRLEFPELPQTDEIIRIKTTHTIRERSISWLRYPITDNSRIKNVLHRCRAEPSSSSQWNGGVIHTKRTIAHNQHLPPPG